MERSRWRVLWSILLLCLGGLIPIPVLAEGIPPLVLPIRQADVLPVFNHTPSQATAACIIPSTAYAAISVALADPSCDPIIVGAGTYIENLVVARPVTIRGADAATTIVDGGGVSSVFVITNTAAVTLTGLTIQNGVGFSIVTEVYSNGIQIGGGVCNYNGSLTIQDSVIYSNTGYYGGGMINYGTARIENTAMLSNTGIYYGGAIHNAGTNLTLNNSTISYNNTQYDGGGVYNVSNMAISGSTIRHNTANDDGGGIANQHGNLIVNDSTISHNTTSNDLQSMHGGGGLSNLAISANAAVELNRTVVMSNTVVDGLGGGGIANHASVNTLATVTLNDCLVQGNVASGNNYMLGFGGGIKNGGNDADIPPTGVAMAVVTLNNSTIRGNKAVNGAGIGNGTLVLKVPEMAMITLNNSTVNDNTAAVSAGGTITQTGNGGGVFNVNATLSIINSTISGNSAQGQPVPATQSGLGGGVANASGGITSTVSFVNATVAGNTAVGGGGIGNAYLASMAGYPPAVVTFKGSIIGGNQDLFGATGCLNYPGQGVATLSSQGYNLEDSITCGFSTTTNDLAPANPLLGPLADNGGRTETHALLEGSPAIDAFPTSACTVSTDQRGLNRPQGGACDVGAYEKAAPTLSVTKTVMSAAGSIVDTIPNGDFEDGRVEWDEYSALGYNLITHAANLDVPPHSDSWATWLGGENDEASYIEQQVTVPISAPYLIYWHWIGSTDGCGYDYGYVIIDETVVDKYDLCADENTGGWIPHVINLSDYAGQSVNLLIGAETDFSEISNLFIDDVFFRADPATDVPLGGEVWYTIVIQNSGSLPASAVMVTDVLPSGVTFGTGIITGSAVLPAPNTLTWGPWDVEAGDWYTLRFNAIVGDDEAFAGQTIVNTVTYTSVDAGSGSNQAVFTIVKPSQYMIYLPMVLKAQPSQLR
ncbi:MAG: DUF11 domain-containing protein [Anaerolineae bacterium]|nr:DUF11 domain-containing protein [Anaerolineae bacterium]